MKKEKKVNILSLFLKMLLVFLIYDIMSSKIYPLLSKVILYGRFGREFIIEMSCVLIAVVVLKLANNMYVFSEKREKFINSLAVGGFMIVFSFMSLGLNITELETFPKVIDIASLILYCLAIGIMEEILCRGWIQNEFLERYGKTQKQIIISIFLSSLLFGGMHISNIWIGGQGVIETTAQIIQAVGAGFLLGTIYYRTKNIWANAFIHGFWDFSLYLGLINTIKDCTEGNVTNKYLVSIIFLSLILATIYILIGIYILRKSKIKDLVPEETYTEEEIKKAEKNKGRLIFVIIVLYFAMSYAPDYDDPKICYTYEDKIMTYNEIIYPEYTTYSLTTPNTTYEFKQTKKSFSIIDKTTNEEKEFENGPISDFEIIKNNNNYLIILIGLNEYGTDTVTYYSYFEETELIEEEFLNNIMSSFKKLETAPTIEKVGYIVSEEENMKYVFLETYKKDKLVLIEEDLYLLNKDQ